LTVLTLQGVNPPTNFVAEQKVIVKATTNACGTEVAP